MKSYPHIVGAARSVLGRPCIAFYKYDGSNLRWEWSKKRGFYKFGTRNRLFDATDDQFGDAIALFEENYAEPITRNLVNGFRGLESATVFTEYFGKSSFAGTHVPDEPKELRLFDVQIHRKGFLGPKEFLQKFGDLPFSAEVLYEGNFNKEFIENVREGRITNGEGVIAKGGSGHDLWMAKVKTKEYLYKLMDVYGSRWEEFAE